MPMYAYACKDCGHTFDIQQSFSDDSLTVCPVCDGALRKKFNSVGVVFKGSGFYRNDSRATTSSTDTTSAPATPSSSSETSGAPTPAGASAGSSAGAAATPAAAGADRAAS